MRIPGAEKMAHLLITPTPDGELSWIRLIDPKSVPTIDDLGFTGIEGKKIRQVLARQIHQAHGRGPVMTI